MADNTKKVNWYDRQRVDKEDMDVEQSYNNNRIANIFNRALGNGVISGLAVSDDSEIINQNAQDSFYDTFLDTVGNRIIQIFKASSNNLQQLIVYGQRNGSAGNVLFSIYSLTDPTNPNSGISALVGQKVEPHTVFPLVAGEATVGFAGVAALTTAGSLTVDNYYALVVERDSAFGSIDLYYTTTNPYADGHIVEYDVGTGLFTTRATWDIYFKLYSDCVQISSGYGYQLGNPIEVPACQYKVNLADTSGITNYICIKYYQILTDYETHPRTGQLVPSRQQDYFQVVIRTNAGDIASDELLLATVAHGGAWPLTVVDARIFVPSNATIWDAYTNKNVILIGQTVNPALIIKDCVYFNSTTSRWEKANFTHIPQGVYTASGEIILEGYKSALSGLLAGTDYYMDATGNLTTTQTHIKIGYALSATELLIKIEYDFSIQNIDDVYKEFYFYGLANTWKLLTLTNLYNQYFIRSTWVVSGNLNTARYGLAGVGTQNSAVCFGGFVAAVSAITEKFYGSTWETSGNLNTARTYIAGVGVQNAVLSFGGSTGVASDVTEKFDGTTWAVDVGWVLNTARYGLAGSGIQNAALSFGGDGPSAVTESFDGATWTAGNNLNTARVELAGSGTQNATLSFGGNSGAVSAATEKFNGFVWLVSNNLNTARWRLGGSGTQNSALSFGGDTAAGGGTNSAVSEKFNGNVWLALNNINTARRRLGGTGSQNVALNFGGYAGANSNQTEKFIGVAPLELFGINKNDDIFNEYKTDSHISFGIHVPSILTCELRLKPNSGLLPEEQRDLIDLNKLDYGDGIWTVSGNLNTARHGLGNAGTQNSALSFGGYDGDATVITEQFNNTIWTTDGGWNLNVARYFHGGCGVQEAALAFGGYPTGNGLASEITSTEKFSNAVWNMSADLNVARYQLAGSGVQNAALSFGGGIGAVPDNTTEKFNGIAWAVLGLTLLARQVMGAIGPNNATLSFGGHAGAVRSETQKFNGLTWTYSGPLNTARSGLAGSGTQNAALGFGGFVAAVSALTEKFNSITWLTSSNLNTARQYIAGSGTQNAALSFGGNSGVVSTVTEKFNTELTLPFTGLVMANILNQ